MHKPTRWSAGLAGLAATAIFASSAALAEVKLRIQAAVPTKADEAVMLGEFAKDVSDLTNGELHARNTASRRSGRRSGHY